MEKPEEEIKEEYIEPREAVQTIEEDPIVISDVDDDLPLTECVEKQKAENEQIVNTFIEEAMTSNTFENRMPRVKQYNQVRQKFNQLRVTHFSLFFLTYWKIIQIFSFFLLELYLGLFDYGYFE